MKMSDVDQEYERRIQAMTPMERVARCAAMLAWTRQQIGLRLRKDFPELTDEQLKWRVAAHIYAGEPEVLKLIEKASKRVPG